MIKSNAAKPDATQPAGAGEKAATPQSDATAKAHEKLAEEAEQMCVDLERFFKRAFGEIPAAADLGELRAQQAMLRDLVRRAATQGEGGGAKTAELAAECEKFKDAAVRARADFLNYQARAQKDLERSEELALRGYAGEMLPILDSYDLALQDIAKGQADPQHLIDILKMLETSTRQVLAVRGLQRIEAKGKPFDPTQHEAVVIHPADKAAGEKPGHVLEDLRSGYLWKGLILRPAQVVVAEAEKSQNKA